MNKKEIKIKIIESGDLMLSSWNPMKYIKGLVLWYYWGIRWIFSPKHSLTKEKKQ